MRARYVRTERDHRQKEPEPLCSVRNQTQETEFLVQSWFLELTSLGLCRLYQDGSCFRSRLVPGFEGISQRTNGGKGCTSQGETEEGGRGRERAREEDRALGAAEHVSRRARAITCQYCQAVLELNTEH
eukprot:1306672-Rhodomonas_salina.1